jgi:broad specificity phosphatase PhoE
MEAVVIVARHGERLDYVIRDAGGNWTATADRPFDSPLTEHGMEQGRKLGKHLTNETKRLGISQISNIYASPLLRCRQTAIAALQGSSKETSIPPVKVELGLAESINESWYRSWALPGSDGTWGYRPLGANRKVGHVDPDKLHAMAKQPVQTLLDWKANTEIGSSIELLLDFSYVSKTSIEIPFCFYPSRLESREEQRRRMFDVVEAVSEPGKTILLVSHGGPVTHLYEEMTGNPWHVHGESTYCCYSIYRKTNGGCGWETLAVNNSDYLHEKMVTECHVSDTKE